LDVGKKALRFWIDSIEVVKQIKVVIDVFDIYASFQRDFMYLY
jgi:hypothetical protein